MQFWWERYPGRLEYEIAELEALGAKVRAPNRDITSGEVRLGFDYPYHDQAIAMQALYPPHYPFARFEVLAPELKLERHQNPIRHNLCLLTRSPASWDTTFTVARVLNERLPRIFAAQTPDAVDPELEEPQGEPGSAALPCVPDAIFLVSSDWKIPANVCKGRLSVGIMDLKGAAIRGIVLAVYGESNNLLASAPSALAQVTREQVECDWYRLHDKIENVAPKQFLATIGVEARVNRTVRGLRCGITGFLLMEEIEYRRVGDSWVFVVTYAQDMAGFRKGRYTSAYFARSARAGPSDMSVRVPMTSALAEKRIAIAGAGCLGAASILEFAKAGVSEIRISDHDIIEPATTVRWPLGLTGAGRSKVIVLKEFLGGNYPLTAVKVLQKRIGGTTEFWGASDPEIEQFCNGADLIFDATVDDAANDILAGLARERRVPYVYMSGTEGGIGGRIVLVRPDDEMCWTCWLHHLGERQTELVPPSEPSGRIRPIGCSEPTFTGANYDMQEISLTAVRASVLLLSKEPAPSWNVGILSLKTDAAPAVPLWTTHNLGRHPKCPNHQD